jgi:hypothetical protein
MKRKAMIYESLTLEKSINSSAQFARALKL